MLQVEVKVNNRLIDNIWIQNVGKVPESTTGEVYFYKIRKPEGYEHRKIRHLRSAGWGPLVIDVIDILMDEGEI